MIRRRCLIIFMLTLMLGLNAVSRAALEAGASPEADFVAVAYTGENFTGAAWRIPGPGKYYLWRGGFGLPNDSLASLRVRPGYEVILFEHDQFGGSSKIVAEDAAGFSDDWNRQASSLEVRPTGRPVAGAEWLTAASAEGAFRQSSLTPAAVREAAVEDEARIDKFAARLEHHWYGTTTDDQRIAMGGELLNIFKGLGYDVSEWQPAGFAQMMNNFFDWRKDLNVWRMACLVLNVDPRLVHDFRPVILHRELIGGWDAGGRWHSGRTDLKVDGRPLDFETVENNEELMAKLAEESVACQSPMLRPGDLLTRYDLSGRALGEAAMRAPRLSYEGEATGVFRIEANYNRGEGGEAPAYEFALAGGWNPAPAPTLTDDGQTFRCEYDGQSWKISFSPGQADGYGNKSYTGQLELNGQKKWEFGRDDFLFIAAADRDQAENKINCAFLDLNGDGRLELAAYRRIPASEPEGDGREAAYEHFELHALALDPDKDPELIFSYFWTDQPE